MNCNPDYRFPCNFIIVESVKNSKTDHTRYIFQNLIVINSSCHIAFYMTVADPALVPLVCVTKDSENIIIMAKRCMQIRARTQKPHPHLKYLLLPKMFHLERIL